VASNSVTWLKAMQSMEKELADFHASVKAECQNSHQAYRDLELAQRHFEEGMWRLQRAFTHPSTPWKVRHN